MVERRPTQEESKKSDSSEDEAPPTNRRQTRTSFPAPVQRHQLNAWSRELHSKSRTNLFFYEKVPYKTIAMALLFFVVGTLFLWLGIMDLHSTGSISESYEKILLGLIMFIPGSYHTVLAFMACRKADGWNYKDLHTFENEDFFKDD